jgi:hypothetical protein
VKQWSDRAAALFEADDGEGPSREARERVRAGVMARIGRAGTVGTATAAAVKAAAAPNGAALGGGAALGTAAQGAIGAIALKIGVPLVLATIVGAAVATGSFAPGTRKAPGAPELVRPPSTTSEVAAAAPVPTAVAPRSPAPDVLRLVAPPSPRPSAVSATPIQEPRVRAPSAPASASAVRPLESPVASALPAAGTLPAELAQMNAMGDALRRRDFAGAQALADDYARRYPGGAFSEEAQGAKIVARCGRSRTPADRGDAEAFVQAHPSSLLVPRIRTACAAPDDFVTRGDAGGK